MNFDRWFLQQRKEVKILLLIIPGLNWLVEIMIRLAALSHKSNTINLIGLILALVVPIFGYIDLVFYLLFDRFIFQY